MTEDLALSVQQPWAWLIVNADLYPNPKRIENRTWSTKVRGRIKIHASKSFDRTGYKAVIERRPELLDVMPKPDEFEKGGVVGEAVIVDCVDDSEDQWYTGDFAFILADAKPLPFVSCPGKLRIFDLAHSQQPKCDPRQLWLFPPDEAMPMAS